jgi:DNA polymerase
MFIGEAPGEAEDQLGEPFIGKGPNQAGTILNERLTKIGLRRTDVYITNVVLCRPTEIKNGRPPSNRPPSGAELTACASWLNEQVIRVNPSLVVPLGVPAACKVLGREVTMAEVRGKVLEGEGDVWRDRLVIATYHPTGIRGNPQRKAEFEEDFDRIRDVLATLDALKGPEPYYSASPLCKVCFDKPRANPSYLCDRCYRILDRPEPRVRSRGWKVDREARFWAMKDRWKATERAFTCYFTGLALEEDDRRHPLYATWEHLQPGDTKVTLAAAFVNSMKCNLTEAQFHEITRELVSVWSNSGSRFNSDLVPPGPWRDHAIG